MGLFERTKHLERLAKEIAEENMRRLSSAAQLDAQTRRQILELEALVREYRLNVDEAEARRQLSQEKLEAARVKLVTWSENAAIAKEKARPDLEEKALERVRAASREHEEAKVEIDHESSTVTRLRAEVQGVERRITMLRELRKGGTPAAEPQSQTRATPLTRKLMPPVDDLEAEFQRLKGSPPS